MNTESKNKPSDIPAVGWYDPSQLLATGRDVIVSSLFSHHADRRAFYTEWSENELKPLQFKIGDGPSTELGIEQAKKENVYYIGNHRNNKDEIWVDYLADTGDGGNATYAVAKTLFDENLTLTDHKKLLPKDHFLQTNKIPRGDLLILGGDLVYPVANEENYRNKFLNFFKAALSQDNQEKLPITKKDATRAVVSFPQNHDWYDNLSSFSQIFCQKEKETFLDMKCPQEQSYAAVKLPYNWWLFGLDFSLTGDIDELQFEYFRKIINPDKKDTDNDFNESSRVIIQYPEPIWTLEALKNGKQNNRSYRYEDLEKLIEEKTKKDIDIRLAGDQHHYRRYSTENSKNHLITCGSGGAFLHPTHEPDTFEKIVHSRKLDDINTNRNYTHNISQNDPDPIYNRKIYYPTSEKSFKLSWKNTYFICHNPSFFFVTAIVYVLVVWLNFIAMRNLNDDLYSNVKNIDFSNFFDSMGLWFYLLFLSPATGIIIILMFLGLGFFAGDNNAHISHGKWFLGIIHGLCHYFMIFVSYWSVIYLANCAIGFIGSSHSCPTAYHINPMNELIDIWNFIYIGVLQACLGGFIGSCVMGMYLFISINLHKLPFIKAPLLHSNEAFSSLKIQDYKGFLRFKITEEKLEAFFIGIDKVPTKWEENSDTTKPTWQEAKDETIQAKLIDYWTVE